MPRTGGVFSLLSGSKGTPNTTIQSAPYNAQLDDFVQDANQPRPITAGGTGATNVTQMRGNFGLVPGTDIQAYSAALKSIADLTTSADRLIYTTAADAYATTALTPFARTILDDADAVTARTTLGLGTLSTLNAVNDSNWSGAALAVANGGTGATTAADARTNIGLGNVDNTSDANKPVSSAQQDALNTKVAKAGDTITGNLTISAGTEELLTLKNTSAAVTGTDARIVLRARNRSDNTYAEIGQRSNGHGYFWVAGKNWEFRSDGYIALPDGGSVSPRGDVYIANYGGLSDWIMAIISRSKNIRLSNVGWWDRNPGQEAPDHNMGNGQVMTGLGGGFDGRVHKAYSRQIQQTDLWGNWYGVGSM